MWGELLLWMRLPIYICYFWKFMELFRCFNCPRLIWCVNNGRTFVTVRVRRLYLICGSSIELTNLAENWEVFLYYCLREAKAFFSCPSDNAFNKIAAGKAVDGSFCQGLFRKQAEGSLSSGFAGFVSISFRLGWIRPASRGIYLPAIYSSFPRLRATPNIWLFFWHN